MKITSKFALTFTLTALSATLAFAVPPIPTVSSISFSANPVVAGNPSTVTASVSPLPPEGKFRLEQMQLAGLPVGCGTIGAGFVTLSETNPPAAINYPANTAVPGLQGYRAQYIPSGGSGYHESQSACIDLEITAGAECLPSGLSITAINGSGDTIYVGPFTGSFTIKVKNCTLAPISNLTAQGGTSAWTTVTSTTASDGTSVGTRKSTGGGNKILLWTIGTLDPGEEATLLVNLSGTTKSAGTVQLNGAWSVSSLGVKLADYTLPITITVI